MGSSRVQVCCPSCKTVFLPSVKEVQSRAGASARRKGANFERTLAKKFQKWWGHGVFKRTPMSGGSVLKDGFDMAGDLACNASDWIWHIEAKNAPGSYAGLHQFFSAEKFVFWKWWDQACGDCPSNKKVMIVFNRYDQPTMCAALKDDVNFRILLADIPHMEFITRSKIHFCLWSLDDMLTTSPESWK